jgi:uncharacterized XkdX family phage protein
MVDWINNFYKLNLYTIDQIKEFVTAKFITSDDFKTITGQDYTA